MPIVNIGRFAMDENNEFKGKFYVKNPDGTWSEIGEIKKVKLELTVKDIIDTMNPEQEKLLYALLERVLNGKKEGLMSIKEINTLESMDDNQKKVFFYLVGAAIEKEKDDEEGLIIT